MSPPESTKIGQPSEPGEYDEGMLALVQIIWGDGFLSPGGADELARILEGSDIKGCQVLDIDPALLEGMRTRIERANLGTRIRGVLVLNRGELRPGHLKASKPPDA